LVTTITAAATTIVLVVARVIFMRQKPGAAKDGSVKVFEAKKGKLRSKKVCCGARRPGREPPPHACP